MDENRRRSPAVESLEGRAMLSTVHFDHIVLPTPPAGRVVPVVLTGNLTGSIAPLTALVDGSTTPGPVSYTLRSAGRVKSMGVVQGTLDVKADTATKAGGTAELTLSNNRGTVALGFNQSDLASETRTAAGGLRQVLSYHVDSGTGAFADASGTGTIVMTSRGTGSTFAIAIRSTRA